MTSKEQLDDRYGRGSRRATRTWIIAFVVLGVIAATALAWSVVTSTARNVDVDDLGFTVDSDAEVEVSFRVTSSHDGDVACVIEAMDETFAVVGWDVVEIPGGAVTSDHTLTVPTVGLATTGFVNNCRLR